MIEHLPSKYKDLGSTFSTENVTRQVSERHTVISLLKENVHCFTYPSSDLIVLTAVFQFI